MKTSPLLLFQLLFILSLNKTFAVSSQSLTTPDSPSILVGPVLALTGTSVRIRAQCRPNGSYTWIYFVWGVGGATGFASQTPGQYVGSSTTDTVVTWILSGLVPNATYHYGAYSLFRAGGYDSWLSGR